MTSLPITINRKDSESTPGNSPGKSPSPRWEVRAVRTPTGRRKHFYVDHERRATYWNMPKEQDVQESEPYAATFNESSKPDFPPPPQYYAEEEEAEQS